MEGAGILSHLVDEVDSLNPHFFCKNADAGQARIDLLSNGGPVKGDELNSARYWNLGFLEGP